MEIRLLGPVQLVTPTQVVDVGRPQRRLVLAALAVNAGKPVPTETLIHRVWDDDQPDLARRSLHAHISTLRRLLEQQSDESDPVRIRHLARGYLLDISADRVDLFRVRRLLEQAADHPDDEPRLRLLRQAKQLWHGQPLAGLASPWADRVRHSWRQEHRETVVAWADAELDAGNATVVIEPLSDLARDDLQHQHLVTTLMRALYAIGKPHEANTLYRAAYDQIVKNAGLEIGPEMTRVHLGILRGDLEIPARRTRADLRTPTHAARLQVGNLPPRADSFQHRSVADILHRTTGPGRTTVLTQVVAGLGGVGKTQLAAEFARGLWAAGDLDLMLWVPALSRDSVVSGYVQAGAELGLGPQSEAPERTAARFLAWLATTEQRWMIVLDDLAGPADIRDLWPPDRPRGRTVVTTRRRDADLLGGRNLVEISVFSQAEAIAYMTRKLHARPYLADDVLGVVGDLDALPLALGHAAAYMIDLDLPCSAYRVRFADRRRRLTELFPDPQTLYDGNSRTVATTWTLSIEAADRLPPAGLARPLLEIVSALNPNGIPEAVLAAPTAQKYLAGRLADRPDWTDIRDGLRGLHRFHLVTHEHGMIRVHALVQRAVREELGEHASTAVARAAADAILEIWPEADGETGQLLRANAMALQDNWPTAIWNPAAGIHPVMLRTVESLGSAVQLDEAIRLCRQLIRQATEHLGPRHPDTLALRDQLAGWLGDAGRTQEAITDLGRLLTDVTAALGHDHPMTITVRQNLGYQWGQAGYPAKAVQELTVVLGAQLRSLAPDDPAVITTRNQLVYFRDKARDTTVDPVPELEELVRLATRVYGARNRQTLELRGALAQRRTDHAESTAQMQQVLADMREALGHDHRDVSVLRLNLAIRQAQAGDLTTAADSFQQLLTERVSSHGPYHRDTVATRHSLSKVLTGLGDAAGAAAQLTEVIEGMRRLVGPMHPDTLRRRYELACALGAQGQRAQAVEQLRDVLADQLTVLGGDAHDAVIDTRRALHRYEHDGVQDHR